MDKIIGVKVLHQSAKDGRDAWLEISMVYEDGDAPSQYTQVNPGEYWETTLVDDEGEWELVTYDTAVHAFTEELKRFGLDAKDYPAQLAKVKIIDLDGQIAKARREIERLSRLEQGTYIKEQDNAKG